ncbi:MAG: short-chain fatty acid transporter [Cryomorphaceae bacterium]|nr:short-chain fatty acid transporter [Cryomorphaceae bacterium]
MVDRFADLFRRLLPSPFSIALLLTILTAALSLFLGDYSGNGAERFSKLAADWYDGIFKSSLLVFAFQMMLMLVLGHMLALAPFVNRALRKVSSKIATNTTAAAMGVGAVTMSIGFFNWGFGLIAGAILARMVGEAAAEKSIDMNYPLLGAAGYTGLLVWHGGVSGSSLIKAAESGHLRELSALNGESYQLVPNSLGLAETVFSTSNLIVSGVIFISVLLTLFIAARWRPKEGSVFRKTAIEPEQVKDAVGAERLDDSSLFGRVIGVLILLVLVAQIPISSFSSMTWVTPNFINAFLLALVLILHPSIRKVIANGEEAVGGASGILLQFPLYFGIMGIMTGSGLLLLFSNQLVSVSTPETFPFLTFLSAAIVNVFIPSGGGQWAVQGPVVIQGALDHGLPLSKCILAFAYGDEVSNMLQPFWALPLLGITRLSAKAIFPYTMLLFVTGMVVYGLSVLYF